MFSNIYYDSVKLFKEVNNLNVFGSKLNAILKIDEDYKVVFVGYESKDRFKSKLFEDEVEENLGQCLEEYSYKLIPYNETDYMFLMYNQREATYRELYLVEAPEDIKDLVEEYFDLTPGEIEKYNVACKSICLLIENWKGCFGEFSKDIALYKINIDSKELISIKENRMKCMSIFRPDAMKIIREKFIRNLEDLKFIYGTEYPETLVHSVNRYITEEEWNNDNFYPLAELDKLYDLSKELSK